MNEIKFVKVSSFGRTFLQCRSKIYTLAMAHKIVMAAAKRWPNGVIEVEDGGVVRYQVPVGLKPPGSLVCGVMFQDIATEGTKH